ncbi:DNA replication licensing factor mcm5-A-like [Watersipora subatra]|uniref:DNA replication licensing factor mcm5-A-like n=1 Tax=Watersipora subatra TaxID=2589382 RepID=UPI00355C52AA
MDPGFDDAGIFFSDNLGGDDVLAELNQTRQHSKRKFKQFIRSFYTGNFVYTYRDTLRRHYNLGCNFLEVEVNDVASYDPDLAEQLIKSPAEYLPIFEDATKEALDEILQGQTKENDEAMPDIQVVLKSQANPTSIRELKSEQMSDLLKVSGIVIAASSIKSKATRICLQCRGCRTTLNNIAIKPGLEGYALPRKCNTEQAGRPACPLDPFFIVPDKCKCVDFQVLKLQEAPDAVPNGEMPRHLTLYVDRNLCDKTVPGNKITVTGIYAIKKGGKSKADRSGPKVNVGIRQPYLRVVGLEVDEESTGRNVTSQFAPDEEEEFRQIAASPDVYEKIAKSIAPSIFGSQDIKKSIACLLFGGSRKRLPDGLTRRGDVNVLMLGDPGTAKSQLLKFVEQAAPIAVYTSGKGSSAAGLTASVMRDSQSRNFVLEGGAMVLADGGVVCIDEFDKMREDDRVAIHEAMEQQTISIAKAGLTTTLNTRCSVLAAANSIYGRWDDTKGAENIDFMPTILSRFDMIYIVKDEHNEERDKTLARHVMNIHASSAGGTASDEPNNGELSLPTLRRYITYCRHNCGPRLSDGASDKLKNQYVLMRGGIGAQERDSGKMSAIPITVRQLEAIIRISEALAKMRMAPFAVESDVDEALRLFKASTMEAANSGNLSGTEGFTSEQDREVLSVIERQIKKRFVVGSQVAEQAIVHDFVQQKFAEHAVGKVLYIMLRRGEIQYRMQRKMLYRLR